MASRLSALGIATLGVPRAEDVNASFAAELFILARQERSYRNSGGVTIIFHECRPITLAIKCNKLSHVQRSRKS